MRFYLILFSLFFLNACSTGESSDNVLVEIEKVDLLADSENKKVFEQLSLPPQIFEINTKRDTFLVCEDGTIISIPQNCFINEKGEIINDKIKIEIVEALSISDFLRFDLQTTSSDDVLESAGMLYINAKSGGTQLALREGSSLNIEMPADFNSLDFKIFNGKHDERGNINWVETSSIDNRMIPLPLDELEYTIYTAYRFTDTVSWIQFMDSIILDDPKYKNTYIATAAFEDRLNVLMVNSFHYWEGIQAYMQNPTHEVWEKVMSPDNVTRSINCEPVNIYLKNIDKPLWYADSLVCDYLVEKSIEDSIYYWKSDSKLYKDEWNSHFGYYPIWYFEGAKKQKLTQPAQFDSRGVDMTSPTAKEQLIQKGYSSQEAYEQVVLYRRIQNAVTERRDRKKRDMEKVENRKKIEKAFLVAFKVDELGWVNVDRFLSDETAEEVVFNVKLVSNPTNYCDLTLIIPGRNVAINAIRDEAGNYSFTTKGGVYRRLPVGENAVVVGISMDGSEPYFSMKKLAIQKDQTIELMMQKVSWDQVEDSLANMNPKPYQEGY